MIASYNGVLRDEGDRQVFFRSRFYEWASQSGYRDPADVHLRVSRRDALQCRDESVIVRPADCHRGWWHASVNVGQEGVRDSH